MALTVKDIDYVARSMEASSAQMREQIKELQTVLERAKNAVDFEMAKVHIEDAIDKLIDLDAYAGANVVLDVLRNPQ